MHKLYLPSVYIILNVQLQPHNCTYKCTASVYVHVISKVKGTY